MSTTKTAPSFYARAEASALKKNFPHALTKYKSWVVWKEAPPDNLAERPDAKWKKLPLDASTLNGSDWNNPEHWRERALAMEVFEENPSLRGIGFAFSKADPYTFLDFDHVIDKRGKLEPWVSEFVAMADSYTEISPSGEGIKTIVKARGTRPTSFEFTDSKGARHEIECYSQNKFFAATGNRLAGTPATIRDWQADLGTLNPQTSEEEQETEPADRSADIHAEAVDAITDEKLLEIIRKSKQQKKFDKLMGGSFKGYAGRFAASCALCEILSFWTRANPERIDKLYRSSKLFAASGEEWWSDRAEYVVNLACRKTASKPMFFPPSSGLIVNEDGKARPILANAIAMLSAHPEWKGVLAYNELTLFPAKLKPTPWGTAGNWTDHDDTKLSEWFEHHHLFIDSSKRSGEAAQAVAQMNRFHPVRDYLGDLKWDGTERLDLWLVKYLGVQDTNYARAVARCWTISAVARMLKPGCQADYALLLEGPQGILKSSALRALAGDEFFSDHMPEIGDKDALLELHAVWIMELAELASIRRAETEKVKSFITRRVDHFRAPYDRRVQPYPRTNVFAGSLNDDTPFTDETGNRRYWPVRCGKINIPELREDRDQLWAEAVARYKKGERWWLDSDELNCEAKKHQDERYQGGQWDEIIEAWLESPVQRKEKIDGIDRYVLPWDSGPDEVTVSDILTHAIGKPQTNWTQADKNSVAKCLKHNGWALPGGKVTRLGKRVLRLYHRPGDSR